MYNVFISQFRPKTQFTADQLFAIFKNLKHTHAQYSQIIKQLFKNNVPDFERFFKIYESSVLRKSEYEAFITFLININYSCVKGKEFENPPLCSTLNASSLASIDVVSEVNE